MKKYDKLKRMYMKYNQNNIPTVKTEEELLLERLDIKIQKWKRQEETKRRIELLSQPKSLKKMIDGPRRIHRGKSWYSH